MKKQELRQDAIGASSTLKRVQAYFDVSVSLHIDHPDLAKFYATPDQDCGISSPIKKRKAYDGKCKSGWVDSRFLELIAG